MRKQALIAVVICGVMGFTLAACVPQVPEGDGAASIDSSAAGDLPPDASTVEGAIELATKVSEDNKPEIVTLEDGTQVQRTPDSHTNEYWASGETDTAFNTYYINADNRGCISCHKEGLQELINNQSLHPSLYGGLGADMTVQDCKACHEWFPSLSSSIHGVHSKDSFKGDCLSCHTETPGGDWVLWEEGKYDVLRGIVPVHEPDVDAEFTYEQETIVDLFNDDWWFPGANKTFEGYAHSGKETDDETFDTWEITVSGLVDNPFSITLKDLIAQAPSETFKSTMQCFVNSSGGFLLSNVEAKGIPVSWLLEKAGVKAEAAGMKSVSPGGGFSPAVGLEYLDDGAYLVYEVNGKRLTWSEGFPVRLWYPGHSAEVYHKWLSEIELVDDSGSLWEEDGNVNSANWFNAYYTPVFWGSSDGQMDKEGNYYNKPNAGVTQLHEGEILAAGEPHEFTGYAHAFDEKIEYVEISLDNGDTWKRLDTSDSDKLRWVYWHFTWTPPEPGAYVIMVRAGSESGLVTHYPHKVMFNAK